MTPSPIADRARGASTRPRARRIASDLVLAIAAGAAALAVSAVAAAHILLPTALAPLRVLAHLIGATP